MHPGLPGAPGRHVLERCAADVEHANPGSLSAFRVLQEQHSDAVFLFDIGSIDLILATNVFQPLSETVVVAGDPTSDRL